MITMVIISGSREKLTIENLRSTSDCFLPHVLFYVGSRTYIGVFITLSLHLSLFLLLVALLAGSRRREK